MARNLLRWIFPASDWNVPHQACGFSPPSDLPTRGGTPYARRIARIRTGHAAGSCLLIPSVPAPVFPSLARHQLVAAFLRTPGWPENQNSAPSGRTSRGYAASGATQFHAASAFPSLAHPYYGRGCENSTWHHLHSVPAGSPLSAFFSGNGPNISRCFCPLPSFLTYTHASNRRRRSVQGCATVIRW